MINKNTEKLIKELTGKGWQFMLVYAPIVNSLSEPPEWFWEADFSIELPNGLYDNHQSGFHPSDPNKAIEVAYRNIKEGHRL